MSLEVLIMDFVNSLSRHLRVVKHHVMTTLWWILSLVTLGLLFHALLVQRPDSLSKPESSYTLGRRNSDTIDLFHGGGKSESSLSSSSIGIQDKLESKNPHTKSWKLLPHRGKGKEKKYSLDEVKNITWTQAMSNAREKIYKKRVAHIERSCHQLKKEGLYQTPINRIYTNMRWDGQHDLIWCPIFKAASTTWVKNFLILAGKIKLNRSLHAEVDEVFASPNSSSQRMLQLRKSMKMLIVRHPLDRLLSAYRDKLLRISNPRDPFLGLQICIAEKYPDPGPNSESFRSNTTSKTCYEHIVEELKSKSKKSLKNIAHPTFTQFLLKVRDDLQYWKKRPSSKKIDPHWRPYWIQCGPCQIKYDVIMHTESLDLDNEYVIHKAGLEGIIFNAHTHSSKFDAYNNTSESVKSYYSQVPPWLLKDIVEFYQQDLTIFDYSAQPYFDIVNSRQVKR